LGQACHILARVPAGGDIDLAAEELLVAGVEGLGEGLGLGSGVVHQVLTFDCITGGGQDVGQGVASGQAAAIADGQGASGVSRDEFHLELLPLA
jgi:hypothetical protein